MFGFNGAQLKYTLTLYNAQTHIFGFNGAQLKYTLTLYNAQTHMFGFNGAQLKYTLTLYNAQTHTQQTSLENTEINISKHICNIRLW